MPFLALEGVRVIELATGVAGPYCGKLLADYGAEVLKVEPPGLGDDSRRAGPFPDGNEQPERSGLFLHLNTNKKGVTLDLNGAEAQELLRRLVSKSDVLIESHAPGAMADFGLDYESLADVNPRLVMTSVTPFGQTGPKSNHQFTELTVFAAGGAMAREGIPEREPLKYGGEMAQYFAGSVAASTTMATVFGALMTGSGDWIDISIQECMAGHPHQMGRRGPFAYSGEEDVRMAPHSAVLGRTAYAVGTWECKDGYVSMLPLGPRMWPNIAQMIGRPELVEDPRFVTEDDRAAFDEIFQGWLSAHTRQEIFIGAQAAALPVAPVLEADEVMADEHMRARDHFRPIDHREAGSFVYPGLPFLLSDGTVEDSRPAPRLGEHTEEVLRAVLDVSESETQQLRLEGIV